jgi:hypothetical protein
LSQLRAQLRRSDSKDLFHGDSKAIEHRHGDGINNGVNRGTAEIGHVHGAPVGVYHPELAGPADIATGRCRLTFAAVFGGEGTSTTRGGA